MKYILEKDAVSCSVAELCLLSLGGGNYNKTADDISFAGEILEEIGDYKLSVEISANVSLGNRNIELYGVIDGYFNNGKNIRVDFIKSLRHSEYVKKSFDDYLTYIRICAYLVCVKENVDKICVGIYLKSSDNGERKRTEKQYTKDELEILVVGLLSKISLRLDHAVNYEMSIRPSCLAVPFPYGEVREGQEEMMRGVSSVIKKGYRMFAQAPTGIGKTISALYPAVRCLGNGLIDKIFYFTAKTDTAREAYSATARLSSAGAKIKTIVLSSKDNMCCSAAAKASGLRDGRFCNSRDCEFLKRYSDKRDKAIAELLSMQNGFYSSVIRDVAIKHKVCPYELSLDLSELCDVIICDYNYLFDPFVHLIRYFDGDRNFGEYVFLIDEAHNLADRVRDMYSSTVSKNEILAVADVIYTFAPELKNGIVGLLDALACAKELCHDNMQSDSLNKETGYYISRNNPHFIADAVSEFSARLEVWLKHNKSSEIYETVNGLYSNLRRFACVLDYYDDKFMTYVEVYGDEVKVMLNCIDPSDIINDILSRGRASVMFSATLTPLSYFRDLLGGNKKSLCLELASPYEQENLCVVALDTVSTRFEDRDKSYKKIATLIAAAVSSKAGNYIAYFPSYAYLENVYEAFIKKYPKVNTVVQKKGMTREEHEEFLDAFKNDENKMRIGFSVLGGSFSEGIDLPGNRLIGSIIVGVGLPGFSSERNIMRDYFENRYENGFDYAYTYPGMNNVLQAAGRVIRRKDDRGIVVLIDDRYATPIYKNLFPKHWNHLKYAGNPSSLAEITKKFWEKH